MTDLSSTIIAKSDILNADDLIGRPPLTIKVTKVSEVKGEQPIAISFEGDNGKPYMPCKSMRRVLVHIWGKDGKNYVGRSLTLYRDDKVKFGGLEVGGIRISHMSNLTSAVELALTASKGNKKAYQVKPLTVKASAEPDAALKAAGEDAAGRGLEEYKKWFESITAEQKASILPLHEGWKVKAKKSDDDEAAAAAAGA